MKSKKRKKKDNAVYCQIYREKVRLKRLQSRNFDRKYRKNEAARKAMYRATKREREQQQQSMAATSTVTTPKNDLRKIEGLQRRRQNTAKLKSKIINLENSTKQLQTENTRLKRKIVSLTSSAQQATTDDTTTPSPSPSKILLQNLSPNAKRRATARMMVQKPDMPRGSVKSIREKFGINVSC